MSRFLTFRLRDCLQTAFALPLKGNFGSVPLTALKLTYVSCCDESMLLIAQRFSALAPSPQMLRWNLMSAFAALQTR